MAKVLVVYIDSSLEAPFELLNSVDGVDGWIVVGRHTYNRGSEYKRERRYDHLRVPFQLVSFRLEKHWLALHNANGNTIARWDIVAKSSTSKTYSPPPPQPLNFCPSKQCILIRSLILTSSTSAGWLAGHLWFRYVDTICGHGIEKPMLVLLLLLFMPCFNSLLCFASIQQPQYNGKWMARILHDNRKLICRPLYVVNWILT